eukprot:6305948-Pyramimonas_sp.AAC.1
MPPARTTTRLKRKPDAQSTKKHTTQEKKKNRRNNTTAKTYYMHVSVATCWGECVRRKDGWPSMTPEPPRPPPP